MVTVIKLNLSTTKYALVKFDSILFAFAIWLMNGYCIRHSATPYIITIVYGTFNFNISDVITVFIRHHNFLKRNLDNIKIVKSIFMEISLSFDYPKDKIDNLSTQYTVNSNSRLHNYK